MAYKANGVGGIETSRDSDGIVTRKACIVGSPTAKPARVTVDGVQFGPRRTLYAGNPTQAMLAANNLDIRTLTGKPWPGSATDRFCAMPPQAAPRTDAEGHDIRMAGPNSMRDLERAGLWPSDEERRLQQQAEAKLHNALAYAVRKLVAQGVPKDQAEGVAKARLSGHDEIDVSDLLPPAPGVKSGKPAPAAATL